MSRYRIIPGKAHEEVARLLDERVFPNLCFIDPPFNWDQNYANYKDKIPAGDFKVMLLRTVGVCWEILQPNGVLCLHGPDALARTYIELETALGLNPIAWINWMYKFGQCNRGNWIDMRCHCLIYAKNPNNYTWNSGDVLVQSDRQSVYGDKRTNDSKTPGLRLPGTIWGLPEDGKGWGRIQGNNKERVPERPNQLPEKYLERIILSYTNPGDLVIDPFSGTGTTAVVCRALERDVIAIDIDIEACRATRERIKKGAVNVTPRSNV